MFAAYFYNWLLRCLWVSYELPTCVKSISTTNNWAFGITCRTYQFYILIIQIKKIFGFYHSNFKCWTLRKICIHMILYYLLIWDVTYKTLSIYLVNEKIIVSSFLWSSRPLAIFSSQNISNLYLYFRCYAIFSTRSGPKLYLMHIHKFWQIVRHKKYDQSNENRGNFNSLPLLSFI